MNESSEMDMLERFQLKQCRDAGIVIGYLAGLVGALILWFGPGIYWPVDGWIVTMVIMIIVALFVGE